MSVQKKPLAGPEAFLCFSFGLLLGGANPNDEVDPESYAAADEGYEEQDSHDGGVDAEEFGQATANAGNLFVAGFAV